MKSIVTMPLSQEVPCESGLKPCEHCYSLARQDFRFFMHVSQFKFVPFPVSHIWGPICVTVIRQIQMC